MSSPPPETETYEITLSRDEQWTVHAVLVGYIDDALENDETPPTWAFELLEELEASDETDVFTGAELRRLREAVADYVDRTNIPERDVVYGSEVVDRLEEHLE